jgi:hypothetical protein
VKEEEEDGTIEEVVEEETENDEGEKGNFPEWGVVGAVVECMGEDRVEEGDKEKSGVGRKGAVEYEDSDMEREEEILASDMKIQNQIDV